MYSRGLLANLVMTSLDDALAELAARPSALVLAGGTDLMVELNGGHRSADDVLSVGRVAEKNFMPLQDGDVPATHADVEELAAWTDFRPAMPVPEGIQRFVAWYRSYYNL